MKKFLNSRVFNTFVYSLFALVVPLIALDWQFSVMTILEKPKYVQFGFAGFIAIIVVLAFLRKKLIAWVKGFDKITWFRGLFKWIVYVFPSAFALGVVLITHKYGTQFLYVFGWTFVSHMSAGVFLIRAEKAKIENFKRWVRK